MGEIYFKALHSGNRVASVMMGVIVALIPALIVQILYFGIVVGLKLLVCISSALFFEWIILKLRKVSINALYDGSTVVTGFILALAVPPSLPIWSLLLASFFSVIIAKHIFGGLGNNLFNPAMVGYVVLLVSFPAMMSKWDMPVWFFDAAAEVDAITSATPLDKINWRDVVDMEKLWRIYDDKGYWQYLLLLQGSYIVGGGYLIFRGIISWWLPFTFLITSFIFIVILRFIGMSEQPILLQVLSGSLFFAAFFIITDPVSIPSTVLGRVVFSILVAVFVIIIRTFSNYPDGIAFAVLIGNFIVPTLDLLFRTSVYGRHSK